MLKIKTKLTVTSFLSWNDPNPFNHSAYINICSTLEYESLFGTKGSKLKMIIFIILTDLYAIILQERTLKTPPSFSVTLDYALTFTSTQKVGKYD